ncbi:hypothetical protein [Kribbella sp. NPDC051620]|uniref:hypothetical protein n=1 Tax=Kribbella sp. NPDC051620 TaxID=3364120 RepID=UPI0037982931
MAIGFSDYSKDTFVAPQLSRFTSALIRDMSKTSDQQQHWLANFILNTMVRTSMDDRSRQTLFNFLRRTQFAFSEYELARNKTADYLANPEHFLKYLAAVGHWEVVLSYIYQAYELLTRAEKNALFKKDDGTTLQRLNLLYNRSKHLPKAINSDQIGHGSTLAVWLTNDGLRCPDGHLTFGELAEILEELAFVSDAVQDPLTMHEKLSGSPSGPE